ncbi:histidine kinase [Streptomyces sulfonofaciens]|uniref:histidine kinase n=1 Tax=Streptomyces sulfonofaciens TaxID=68272 RepID=A0A919GM88_9ACTN|nr:nitrate- and nitrite sensing domain-containing protein [Streptomyces sulfonofaciens]GHH86688.1 histidine kinase [Streptomyces sulfonofaciens]
MQGRYKRDGSASAESEPHGGPDRGPSAPHAQNPGSRPPGESGERTQRPAPAPSGQAPKPVAKPRTQTGTGPRIALRNWRISTRLVSLLALPVVAATTLGAVRINQSLDELQQLDNMKLLTDMTKQATELAAALEEERDQSAGPLAHGDKATDFDVKGPRDKTDLALNAFKNESQKIDDTGGDSGLLGIRSSVVQITSQLNTLQTIRKDAYKDPKSSSQTVDAYSQLVQQLLALSEDMAQATSNPDMIQRTRALAAFSSAKEFASVQRAVIAAALPPNNHDRGDLSETDRRYALAAYNKERAELTIFSGIYSGNADELLQPIEDGNPTVQEADTYTQHVLNQEGGMKIQDKRSYKDWVDADSTKIQAMSKIELTLLNEMEQKARELRSESERNAVISGALILLVLGVSLIGAFIVARSMIRSLRRLQMTATKVAQDRLPELVKQLSESDPQDVDTSVESVGVHSRDEIGKVATAFDDVHREAVRLAAEQALLRGNVNAMFTNLSRRSQGLIQRQLSLISELESREADPDQLSSLFKLDHLATRMRRNGENLLVLAGEEPGRRWTRPVPLVDVLRAAASEVEQYERIELAAVPATEVAGRVVNDLVHLLAELLENATSFSSPQTKVKVTGHALPDGRVLVEIHDTGIGLSPEDLAAINERLAAPPTVDVSVSRRMGLFVVGRLSQRHGIRIQLRPSDSGGTTALVMLPVDVAQGGRRGPGKAGAPAAGAPAAAQAAAGAAAARRGAGAAAPGASGSRVGAGPERGQVGAGSAPRAALPSRDTGPQAPQRPGPGGDSRTSGRPQGPVAPQGPVSPQGPGVPRQGNPVGASAFGQDSGTPGLGPVGPVGAGSSGRRDAGFGEGRAPVPPQRTGEADRGLRPQLPARGAPRAELPGGTPQPPGGAPQEPAGQRVPSWSNDTGPQSRPDAPRGHEEHDSPFARMDRQGPGSTGQFPALGGGDRQGPGSTAEMPRIDDRQGPGSTAEFARPDFGAPRPGGQDTGQYSRPDVFGGQGAPDPFGGQGYQDPASTGQFPAPGWDSRREAPRDTSSTGQLPVPDWDSRREAPQGPSSTGQFQAPGYDNRGPQDPASTGQFPAPGYDNRRDAARDTSSTGQFERPAFGGPPAGGQSVPRPQGGTGSFTAPEFDRGGLPMRPGERADEPESLPPAGPGDGRTPLYDTLETNWFRGGGRGGPQDLQSQDAPSGPAADASAGSGGFDAFQSTGGQAGTGGEGPGGPVDANGQLLPDGSTWRSSPNDELVRQAERVRQPTAGGVTTSGLPRRVPRANLVAGTAQQQPHQAGPQVSRAPDDVRGRLTNLRRGIQQGRQAGTGSPTDSFPSPTHQQER